MNPLSSLASKAAAFLSSLAGFAPASENAPDPRRLEALSEAHEMMGNLTGGWPLAQRANNLKKRAALLAGRAAYDLAAVVSGHESKVRELRAKTAAAEAERLQADAAPRLARLADTAAAARAEAARVTAEAEAFEASRAEAYALAVADGRAGEVDPRSDRAALLKLRTKAEAEGRDAESLTAAHARIADDLAARVDALKTQAAEAGAEAEAADREALRLDFGRSLAVLVDAAARLRPDDRLAFGRINDALCIPSFRDALPHLAPWMGGLTVGAVTAETVRGVADMHEAGTWAEWRADVDALLSDVRAWTAARSAPPEPEPAPAAPGRSVRSPGLPTQGAQVPTLPAALG
ncbi:MAG: hypothetical protein RL722_523 [Pseudomonadota bacterium]